MKLKINFWGTVREVVSFAENGKMRFLSLEFWEGT